MNSIEGIKQFSYALKKLHFLESTSHSKLLEAISAAHGYKSYNAYLDGVQGSSEYSKLDFNSHNFCQHVDLTWDDAPEVIEANHESFIESGNCNVVGIRLMEESYFAFYNGRYDWHVEKPGIGEAIIDAYFSDHENKCLVRIQGYSDGWCDIDYKKKRMKYARQRAEPSYEEAIQWSEKWLDEKVYSIASEIINYQGDKESFHFTSKQFDRSYSKHIKSRTKEEAIRIFGINYPHHEILEIT